MEPTAAPSAPELDGAERPALPPPRPPYGGLPAGPRLPRLIQTVRLIRRPGPLMLSCHRRFGDAFTIRALGVGDLVFISDPASIKRLFSSDRENTIAPGRNVLLRPVMGPRSLLLLEGDEHLRRRKVMSPPFHGERMRAYEDVIAEVTERELEGFPRGVPFALHPRMQAITLEVILRAVFGVDDAGRREELREHLVEVLATTQSPRALGMTSRRLSRMGPWKRVAERIGRADQILAEEIAHRRADPGLDEREDILSLLVGARFEDGTAMDDGEIRDQLMTLLLAGHETTATSLAWAFDLLLHAPAALERLREEIDDGGDSYLDAVIDETLRLRPVVPFTGRQLFQPMELGGHSLPAGAVVMVSIVLAHMREDTYPEPERFRPERFLGTSPDTYGWVPFGGGTRRCLGAAFAELEMRVVLRTVLGRLDLRPARSRPETVVRRNVTLAPAHGTEAIAEPRR